MKLLVVSDLHLDAVTAGKPRRDEVNAYLADAYDVVVRERVDLVLFGGDAFDPDSLLQSLYTAMLMRRLLAFGGAGAATVAIPGNHDVVDSSELFENEPITTLTPLRVATQLEPRIKPLVHICESPSFVETRPGWGVLALPYVSRAHGASVQRWTDGALARAARFRATGGRLIVLGHLVVPGAALGSESVEFSRGQDQIFPFERVKALSPTIVINGHYHARQEVLGDFDLPIQIPGSPLRFTFGEVGDEEKGFLMASFP